MGRARRGRRARRGARVHHVANAATTAPVEGEYTPSLTAERDELVGIAERARRLGWRAAGGVRLRRHRRGGRDAARPWPRSRPAAVDLAGRRLDAAAATIARVLAAIDAMHADGLEVRAQVAARGIGMLLGLQATLNPFGRCPSYREVARLPLAERVVALREPSRRAAIVAEWPDHRAAVRRRLRAAVRRWAIRPTTSPPPTPAWPPWPQRAGRDAADLAYDLLLADDGTRAALQPDPQLPGRQPRRRPRAARAPARGARPGRRRCPRRHDLRRQLPHDAARALVPRPDAGASCSTCPSWCGASAVRPPAPSACSTVACSLPATGPTSTSSTSTPCASTRRGSCSTSRRAASGCCRTSTATGTRSWPARRSTPMASPPARCPAASCAARTGTGLTRSPEEETISMSDDHRPADHLGRLPHHRAAGDVRRLHRPGVARPGARAWSTRATSSATCSWSTASSSPIVMGTAAAAGKPPEEIRVKGDQFEDLHRGGWDPDGPPRRPGSATAWPPRSSTRRSGMVLCNHRDADFKHACFQAYNRWIAEYCVVRTRRACSAVGQTAMRTPEEGIADLQRIKAARPARRDDAGPAGRRGRLRLARPTTSSGRRPSTSGCRLSFHILTTASERHRGPKMSVVPVGRARLPGHHGDARARRRVRAPPRPARSCASRPTPAGCRTSCTAWTTPTSATATGCPPGQELTRLPSEWFADEHLRDVPGRLDGVPLRRRHELAPPAVGQRLPAQRLHVAVVAGDAGRAHRRPLRRAAAGHPQREHRRALRHRPGRSCAVAASVP